MNQNTIRLDSVAEPFFRDAIERYVELHCAHYGERLAAIYVEGSVHRNEAIPGVSDLDTYVFIEGARNENDHSWQQQTQERLRREIPGFHVVPDAVSVEEAFPLSGLLTRQPKMKSFAGNCASASIATTRQKMTRRTRDANSILLTENWHSAVACFLHSADERANCAMMRHWCGGATL